jgi:hypothetical protein
MTRHAGVPLGILTVSGSPRCDVGDHCGIVEQTFGVLRLAGANAPGDHDPHLDILGSPEL